MRRFKITRTETVVKHLHVTEEQMHDWFPDVQWDRTDVSHAGEAEDCLLGAVDECCDLASFSEIEAAIDAQSDDDFETDWALEEL